MRTLYCVDIAPQALPDLRDLHNATHKLQLEQQNLEQRKKFKAGELQQTKEELAAAQVIGGAGLPAGLICLLLGIAPQAWLLQHCFKLLRR